MCAREIPILALACTLERKDLLTKNNDYTGVLYLLGEYLAITFL